MAGKIMKKQSMYFKMITSSMIRRRSRMLVALLAVAIGATILSGLITIYYGIPQQLEKEFRSYGANLILVPSGNQAALNASLIQKSHGFFSGRQYCRPGALSLRDGQDQ